MEDGWSESIRVSIYLLGPPPTRSKLEKRNRDGDFSRVCGCCEHTGTMGQQNYTSLLDIYTCSSGWIKTCNLPVINARHRLNSVRYLI